MDDQVKDPGPPRTPRGDAGGNGDGEDVAPAIQLGAAIPWMPEGWWRPMQCLDRFGRQITIWSPVHGCPADAEPLYLGHGGHAEKFPEGTMVEPVEFIIEGVKSFEEAAAKYDADFEEAGALVGEAMRKNYTRAKLMAPPLGGPPHSGAFNRMNRRPRI